MRLLFKILLFTVIIGCDPVSNGEKSNIEDDIILIEELMTARFNEFQNSSNPIEQAQIYVRDLYKDAAWMPQNHEVIKGKIEIQKWAEWFFSTYRLVLDPNKQLFEKPVVDGHLAYRRFISAGHYVKIATGDSIPFDQKYIDTFKKIDGKWKITSHMWSSNNQGLDIWKLSSD